MAAFIKGQKNRLRNDAENPRLKLPIVKLASSTSLSYLQLLQNRLTCLNFSSHLGTNS